MPGIAGTAIAYVLNYQIITSEDAAIASTATYLLPLAGAVSAGGKGSTGHGNACRAAVLGNAAAGAAKTGTFLGERYRRIARRRGSKRAIDAAGRSILVIAWHLLSDPESRFTDLGPGFYATHIARTPQAPATSARSKRLAAQSLSSPPPDLHSHARLRRGLPQAR